MPTNNNLPLKICCESIAKRVILRYPPLFLGVRYPLVGNLLYQVTKTSHLMVSSSHCAIPTSHVTVFCYFSWFPYFFSYLIISSSHYAIPTSLVTVLCHIWWFLYFFFLTFDSSILTLCSTNITCDCTFVTFSGSFFFFFSHLTVSSSYCTIPNHIWLFCCHI